MHHDNTFGTTEEDAFRRDFTINALFYDIGDPIGHRLRRRPARPRAARDPVDRRSATCGSSKTRCACCARSVLAARLGFDIDELVIEAIAELRRLIAKASPARLLEEYFKILRSGSAEATFRATRAACACSNS